MSPSCTTKILKKILPYSKNEAYKKLLLCAKDPSAKAPFYLCREEGGNFLIISASDDSQKMASEKGYEKISGLSYVERNFFSRVVPEYTDGSPFVDSTLMSGVFAKLLPVVQHDLAPDYAVNVISASCGLGYAPIYEAFRLFSCVPAKYYPEKFTLFEISYYDLMMHGVMLFITLFLSLIPQKASALNNDNWYSHLFVSLLSGLLVSMPTQVLDWLKAKKYHSDKCTDSFFAQFYTFCHRTLMGSLPLIAALMTWLSVEDCFESHSEVGSPSASTEWITAGIIFLSINMSSLLLKIPGWLSDMLPSDAEQESLLGHGINEEEGSRVSLLP